MDSFALLLDDTGKVVLAALLGGLIGWEREVHGQAAGFRTNILVALGACLMMMLSLHMQEMFAHLDESSVVRLDPARIASYAIASMGFLGAGAIIKGRGTVRGLTTAAGLWMVTGIGLAVGAGYFIPAILTCLASMFILYAVRKALRGAVRHDTYSILSVTCGCGLPRLKDIKAILSEHKLSVMRVNYYYEVETGESQYKLQLRSKDDLAWGRIAGDLLKMEGIIRLAWEDAEVP